MATSTELGASANGDLVNRVQQLRLDGQLGAGKGGTGGGSWLPWVLCGLLAVTWAGVGVRGYKTAAQKSEDAPGGAPRPARRRSHRRAPARRPSNPARWSRS